MLTKAGHSACLDNTAPPSSPGTQAIPELGLHSSASRLLIWSASPGLCAALSCRYRGKYRACHCPWGGHARASQEKLPWHPHSGLPHPTSAFIFSPSRTDNMGTAGYRGVAGKVLGKQMLGSWLFLSALLPGPLLILRASACSLPFLFQMSDHRVTC